MKFLNFFLLLCVIFALLDPDPGYGSATLVTTVGYLPLPTGRPLFLAGTEVRSSPFLFLPTREVFRDLPPSPPPAFTTEYKASE